MPGEKPDNSKVSERDKRHYRIEKELADRLRQACKEDRSRLYCELYDELFRRVPDHVLLTRKDDAQTRTAAVNKSLRLLRGLLHPDTVMLEVGPGDCALSKEAAARVARVYAVDVSEELTKRDDLPDNVEVIISDGSSIPLPPGSADLAYSNQLMEHLHPEDARHQVQDICKALGPGGTYVCITPNRLSGPHDISRGFSDVAQGFHLKEYTNAEIAALFKECGFSKCKAYLGKSGVYLRVPLGLKTAFERLLEALPRSISQPLARSSPGRLLLRVVIAARK